MLLFEAKMMQEADQNLVRGRNHIEINTHVPAKSSYLTTGVRTFTNHLKSRYPASHFCGPSGVLCHFLIQQQTRR